MATPSFLDGGSGHPRARPGGGAALALRARRARGGRRAATGHRPRRLPGMLCDVLSVWLIGGFAGVVVNVWRLYVLNADPADFPQGPANLAATAVPLVFIGALVLATGRTVGDLAMLIRWEGGVRPPPLGGPLRYLGGIGGWQLLVLSSPLDVPFVLASLVVLFAVRGSGGPPGVVSRMRPVDAREGTGAPTTGRGARRRFSPWKCPISDSAVRASAP